MLSIAQLPGAAVNHRYRIYRESALQRWLHILSSASSTRSARGRSLSPRPAPICRRRRPAAGRRPRASTADGRCGSRRRAASSRRYSPRRCRAWSSSGWKRAQRVGPALVDDPAPRGARLRLHQRVVRGRPDREDVAVLGHDVPVARKHDRPLVRQQLRGMLARAAPSSGACSRTSRCRPDCRWAGRASRRRRPSPRPRCSGCGCRRDRREGRRGAAPACRPSARIATPLKPFCPCQTAP